MRELYAIVDDRRWDDLHRVLDPAVVYERPGYPAFEGLDRVRQFYEHERVIAAGVHHITSALVAGDEATSQGVFEGAHRNGTPLEERFAEFFQLREGKIVSRRTYFFRAAI